MGCFYTEEEGTICLCIIDDCNIVPLNGTQCTNVNECAFDNGGCHHSCVDTEGSFYCSCPAGFTLASDLLGCEDVDECSLNPCSGTTCINTYGSYYCLTSSDVSSGNVAALVGEAAVASTVSAVGSAMIVLIVVLAVRRIQTSRMI